MPKGFPITQCKSCGRDPSVCGQLSATYLCRDCGKARANANLVGLTTRSGPYFKLWRQRMAASVGAAIADEERTGT